MKDQTLQDRQTPQLGIVTAELLVTALLSATLFFLTFSSISASLFLHYRLNTALQLEEKTLKVLELFRRGITSSQVRYAINGIRLHPRGVIHDMYGNPHPVHRGEFRLQPHENGVPVSFLMLDDLWLIKVSKRQGSRSGNPITFLLCAAARDPDSGNSVALSNIHSWIAVSIDGYLQLEGRVKSLTNRDPGCRQGRSYLGKFKVSSPMMYARSYGYSKNETSPGDHFFAANANISRNSFLLIPISQAYTVYLDQEHSLRRLSHISRENQPLVEDIESFLIENTARLSTAQSLKGTLSIRNPQTNQVKTKTLFLSRINVEGHSLLDVLP